MRSKPKSDIPAAGPPGSNEQAKRSGDKSTASRPVTASDIRRLLEAQAYRCALTGRELTPETASVDHRVPLARGGEHQPDNVQVVHRDVNDAKGTMTQAEFVALCREVVAWMTTTGEATK